MRPCRSIAATCAVVLSATLAVLGPAAATSAHTGTDVVAVHAGGEAVVTFRPTHGCGESSTVAVLVRAPVADAVAEDVDGWQASSTPDGNGNTVLEWSGGSLPTDQAGAFPVEFVVPDAVGQLLTFPAVQRCESGDELAWISGDPADEYPAPRLLVLAAGSEPAATIDDVPLDAPGRDQIVAIVDVDNPSATTVTTAAPTAEPTVATADPGSTATTPAVTESSAPPVITEPTSGDTSDSTSVVDDAASSESGDGSSAIGWVIAGVVLAAGVAAGVFVWRRRVAP